MNKIKIENNMFSGGLWVAAWLFVVGFLNLSSWKVAVALILWPYFLGDALRFMW